MSKIKEEIKKALEVQKEIFGDELYEPAKRRTVVLKNVPKTEQAANTTYSSRNSAGPVSVSTNPEVFGKQISVEIPGIDVSGCDSLEKLNNTICNCLSCPLGSTRSKFVFGSGNPSADVMVIGEGPGKEEDKLGLPFVGRAGQLLTDILAAIKFKREEVYIANIVKCRPPENRVPFPSEMEACIPYLKKQIQLIKPKLILALGLTAAQGLLKQKGSMKNLRGQVFSFEGAKVMITYHPAALLRNPEWKKDCWIDVQAFRRLYDAEVK
jgi:uracil-DNA glycosylase family 4